MQSILAPVGAVRAFRPVAPQQICKELSADTTNLHGAAKPMPNLQLKRQHKMKTGRLRSFAICKIMDAAVQKG